MKERERNVLMLISLSIMLLGVRGYHGRSDEGTAGTGKA